MRFMLYPRFDLNPWLGPTGLMLGLLLLAVHPLIWLVETWFDPVSYTHLIVAPFSKKHFVPIVWKKDRLLIRHMNDNFEIYLLLEKKSICI